LQLALSCGAGQLLPAAAGVTTEVDLQPGQLLLYESAKCTHGRPRTFRGHWYTSLFVHYRPQAYKLKPNAERLELVGGGGTLRRTLRLKLVPLQRGAPPSLP
jgi:hypothetical protein